MQTVKLRRRVFIPLICVVMLNSPRRNYCLIRMPNYIFKVFNKTHSSHSATFCQSSNLCLKEKQADSSRFVKNCLLLHAALFPCHSLCARSVPCNFILLSFSRTAVGYCIVGEMLNIAGFCSPYLSSALYPSDNLPFSSNHTHCFQFSGLLAITVHAEL